MQDIYNRIAEIDKICYSQQFGIDSNQKLRAIEQVVTKFKDNLTGYKYCDNPENINKGSYIKYIDMAMTKICYGLVIDVYQKSGENISYSLKSTYSNKYWKIDPYKYYIFHKSCTTKQKKKTNKLIEEYLTSTNNAE